MLNHKQIPNLIFLNAIHLQFLENHIYIYILHPTSPVFIEDIQNLCYESKKQFFRTILSISSILLSLTLP